MMQDFIVLTAAQRAEAEALNRADAAILPRLVDGEDAGQLLGSYVAPARLLEDESYARWHLMLANLPRQDLDPAILFAPPTE